MKTYEHTNRAIICLSIFILFLIIPARSLATQISFTQEEQDYLENTDTLRAVSIHGIAPLLYTNNEGKIVGIFKDVLDLIADLTSLRFDLILYDSVIEAIESKPDLFVGVDPIYSGAMTLSKPFLRSDTVLFLNSGIEPDDLEHKRHAIVQGSSLPKDIAEEYIVSFGTREQTLDAVDRGQADYGHGNAYSVAFYKLLNGYKNVITVPMLEQDRQYSIALPEPDVTLLSIINKAIDAIEEHQMQAIILRMATEMERKITFSMVLGTYGPQIMAITALIILVLSISVFFSIRATKRLALQNSRYELLAHMSNEYLYEYDCATRELVLSDQLEQLLSKYEYLTEMEEKLKTMFLPEQPDQDHQKIRFVLPNGETSVFQSVTSTIYDGHGRAYSVIGKLVDVTREASEREELLSKSQRDGLTGLYNATTVKELVTEHMGNRPADQRDAFVLLDLDRLKQINDSFGHLAGNKVLTQLSESLKTAFGKNDIIGRVGGDEFCIYIQGISSIDSIRAKCQKVNASLKKAFPGIYPSVSIGVALFSETSDYETMFEKADKALYQAKDKGIGNVVIEGDM